TAANAKEKEERYPQPRSDCAEPGHQQARPAVRNGARVRSGGVEDEALQYLASGLPHGDGCQPLRRTRSIGGDSKRYIARLLPGELFPTIGIERIRVVETEAVIRRVVETEHRCFGDGGLLVQGDGGRSDAVGNPKQGIEPQRLINDMV